MRGTLSLLCTCLFGVAASLSAKASTIGGGGCASCDGSTYTLTYNTTADPNVFDIFLTIDSTGFTNAATDDLNAVALKLVAKDSDITSVSLLSEPSSFGTTAINGLNGGGCTSGGSGYFCSQSSGNGVPVAGLGDIYTFEWVLALTAPSDLKLGVGDDTVKAVYIETTNTKGSQDGITNEAITLTAATTPEPSSLLLLGTGLTALAAAARRKNFI